MDQQKRSKDRNAKQPENGQLMSELKSLKASIVKKDLRIKELEEQVKQVAVLGKQIVDLENRVSQLQLGVDQPGPIFALGALPPPAKP